MNKRVPLLARQDFLAGLAIIGVAAFALWLARSLPGGAAGGMGPGTLVSAWNALFAPRGLPKDTHAKLADTLVKALDDEATRKRLLELGSVIPDRAGRSPQALQKLVESEVARWTPILKRAQQ